MTIPTDDRKNELREWLRQNVLVPPRPSRITVTDIQFDWPRMRGTFVLALDGVALEQRFSVYYAMNGRIEFSPPWVHSPVRLPITVSTIELDQQTQAAVQRALDRTFPVIRAYGLHKKGKIVDANSSLKGRIIKRPAFDAQRAIIDAGNLAVEEPVSAG